MSVKSHFVSRKAWERFMIWKWERWDKGVLDAFSSCHKARESAMYKALRDANPRKKGIIVNDYYGKSYTGSVVLNPDEL